MERRALIGNIRERRVRSPTAFGRAARNKKTRQHDQAADPKRPETGGVYFWKRHVRRADLERHNEIAKRRERDRHNAKEDHDRAVHCA